MNRFRTVFVYLLIIMAVIVILSWAAKPPIDEPLPEYDEDSFYETASFVSGPVVWSMAAFIVGSYAFYFVMFVQRFRELGRKQERMMDALAETPPAIEPFHTGEPPRAPLAKLLDRFKSKGYQELGRYEVKSSLGPTFTAWTLKSPEADIRLIATMHGKVSTPSALFTTTFADDALLETHYPLYSWPYIKPNYRITWHPFLSWAEDYHKRQVTLQSTKHGPALRAGTPTEFQALMKRALPQSKAFGSSQIKILYVIPVIGGLVVLLLFFLRDLWTPTRHAGHVCHSSPRILIGVSCCGSQPQKREA